MPTIADPASRRPGMRIPTRAEVERAVLASDLPAPGKTLILALAVWSDAAAAAVPTDQSRSLNEICRATSLSRSTVCRHLTQLEDAGWITRKRPPLSVACQGVKTGYWLRVPNAVPES